MVHFLTQLTHLTQVTQVTPSGDDNRADLNEVKQWQAELQDESATLALGASLAATLAAALSRKLVIYLYGDLGSGKTTLVRGVLRSLGYTGNVKSPTYTLVEEYEVSSLNLHHFDFYRLNQPEEYLDAGLDEYFQGEAICLVEWPEKAGTYLAPADLSISLSILKAGRRVEINTYTEAGLQCLTTLSL